MNSWCWTLLDCDIIWIWLYISNELRITWSVVCKNNRFLQNFVKSSLRDFPASMSANISLFVYLVNMVEVWTKKSQLVCFARIILYVKSCYLFMAGELLNCDLFLKKRHGNSKTKNMKIARSFGLDSINISQYYYAIYTYRARYAIQIRYACVCFGIIIYVGLVTRGITLFF